MNYLTTDTLLEILGEEWSNLIGEEFNQSYMIELSQFLINERKTKVIYPDSGNVFRIFKELPYSKIKVVILGQD